MSGGAFNYEQYKIGQIAEAIESRIFHNGSTERDRYGELVHCEFPADIIAEFKRAINLLREAQVYAHRIDWLLSGDDGEYSFRARLREDLNGLRPYQDASADVDPPQTTT